MKSLTRFSRENAKKAITREIEECKIMIVGWENVKRSSKKDGSDFANMSRNFVNARYDSRSWSSGMYLTVYGCINYRHCEDYISCSETVFSLKQSYEYFDGDESKLESVGYTKYYHFTVDEIFDKISKRVNCLNERISELSETLNNIDEYLDNAEKAFEDFTKATHDLPYCVRQQIRNDVGWQI